MALMKISGKLALEPFDFLKRRKAVFLPMLLIKRLITIRQLTGQQKKDSL